MLIKTEQDEILIATTLGKLERPNLHESENDRRLTRLM